MTTQDAHSRTPQPFTRWGFIVVFLIAVAALVGYSIYVAVHEPDPQETVVLGQIKLPAGSPAGLRILVRDRVSQRPIQGAEVVLKLSGQAENVALGSFRTDAQGSVSEGIDIPDIAPGQYQLIIDVRSLLGRDHLIKTVEVQRPVRLLLSSDKPLYQPGQTIHLRSLVLNGRTQKPCAGEPVTFEVSDPKGNKVFKETRPASGFGIVSADFVLASEVNLGRYALRAIAGSAVTERTVEIKRYVLPRFKISLTTGKTYYLPGQTVSGTIEARYFFGKPVSGAEVKLTAATFQEKPVEVAAVPGRTDAGGKFNFQFVLPDFFTGMPQKNEQAFLDLNAEVRDSAGHTEQSTLSLSVAKSELELAAIPEAGAFVPGVENLLYILTAYPDGNPAACTVFVDGVPLRSDAQGVSIFRIPPAMDNPSLELVAADQAGRRTRRTWRAERSSVPLLLRTDKAVYEAGQTAHLTLLSPEPDSTVFLDVIKDNQTILTRSVTLKGRRADYALALPPSLAGMLKLNAYLIDAVGEDRGVSRLVCVNPASALKIGARTSQPVYRPGEVARLDFTVTDVEGHPTPAAIGINAVDESVYALQENRPGLLRQFLETEAELLKPRYQIKWCTPASLMFDTENRQALAQAYFASLGPASPDEDLEKLVERYSGSRELLERVRALRGTPQYEALKRNPEYARIIGLIENHKGIYTLRDATGPVKVMRTEARRKAYFNGLGHLLLLGFCGLIFVFPIFLALRSGLSDGGGEAPLTKQQAQYATLAGSSYKLLSVLVLCPLFFYPFGLLVFEMSRMRDPGLFLLAFEAAVVLGSLLFQIRRIAHARIDDLNRQLTPVNWFLGAFLAQFVVTRAFLALSCLEIMRDQWVALWFLAALIAPLIVLGGLASHLHRQLVARQIPDTITPLRVIDVFIVIAIFLFLIAMLLPALSKSKARSQAVSLMSDLRQIGASAQAAETERDTGVAGPVRVRRDFPETLFWRPELVTDEQGRASLEIPLADSITTWRASVDAVSAAGKLGSLEAPIPVFQDFFVDLDLPVALSLDDQVSIPVTCYNYLKESQEIRLRLTRADWFESPLETQVLRLAANEVKSVTWPIKVRRVGQHRLQVSAQGEKVADALEREIQVMPVGEKVERTENGCLKETYAQTFAVPDGAIPGSASLVARFYPSRFCEVVEGLDGILKAPYGCFEQTSSVTYPNVLVLDYMKRTGRLTPEIEIRARKFINAGYQRLLTFEVSGGGFEWFGRSPANVCLTAYGILEFTDMARVHPVDEAVIARAREWLFKQQNGDGSWDEIQRRGWTWSGRGSMTAFICWALAESGEQSSRFEKALDYLRSHPQELETPYAKALAAIALLAHARNDAFGMRLATELKEMALSDPGDGLHWTSKGYSMTWSHGSAMDVETTALCAMAWMKAGLWPESVKRALTWISGCKSSDGSFGSTQATILAMRALLEATAALPGRPFESTVTLLLNGNAIETFRINQDNSDVMRQIELTSKLRAGENRVELRQAPAGELRFQLAGAYWLPASPGAASRPAANPAAQEPLQIELRYDRATLAVNDQLECAVTVRNNTGQRINMAIVDLGIPPGFEVDASVFDSMCQDGRIAKYELTGNQIILYLRELPESAPVRFEYALRAKYPLRVQTPPSSVYEYYQPRNRAQSKPVALQVAGN